MLIKKVSSVAIAFLIVFSLSSSSFASDRVKLTGTFSSLTYNVEGGDLLGIEIRIVWTRKGYYATVQISEGEPNVPILVPVSWMNRTRGEFVIRIPEPNMRTGKIKGRVQADGLEMIFDGMSEEFNKIKLPRKPSYWD
jgi:hypothetical protein